MEKLLLCTGNQGKVLELKALLPKGIELLSLADVGLPADLPETGATLEANALQKARFAHERTGLVCVADDTGLEVDALAGAPGVHSARYAGDAKVPMLNMAKLLEELRGKEDRRARFRTVIALVASTGSHTFSGSVEGQITEELLGSGGFGYDPVFRPMGSELTFAQMDGSAKNGISHRGIAVRQLVAYLRALPR
ncbi:MAG TPA: RdgB/HAM1 family non-canonical purine NTP pyrophosphatase [Flavobacteriales bacterium]|nr:RdgB/HAM1 family non-canonical purine NTP pyrophosphatase [Flavobacteriales bacterium]